MTPPQTNDRDRSLRHRGPNALGRLSVALILSVGIATPLALGATAANAAPGESEAADEVSFTLTSPVDGSYTAGNSVTFSGEKVSGASVELSIVSVNGAANPSTLSCPASADTAWSCSMSLPDGVVELRAQEVEGGTPTGSSVTLTLRVRAPSTAPSVTGTGGSASSGLVFGTGLPGTRVQVTVAGASKAVQDCQPTVGGDGNWSCVLDSAITSGEFQVRARQWWQESNGAELSPASANATVLIDRIAPSSPVVTSPQAGTRISAQPTVYAGTASEDGTVNVYVDGVPVCTATISAGAWSCEGGGVENGSRGIQAIQRDLAGNFSVPSATISVTFGRALPSKPTPAPTPSAPSQTPEPAPSPSDAPSASPSPTPFFPPPIGGSSGLPPELTWGTPTYYGAAIPLAAAMGWSGWLGGFLLALGFVALVALPLRMLLNTLRGRLHLRSRQFAGRNQPGVLGAGGPDSLLNPWLVAAGALMGAAVLAALAGGVQGEARYLRLFVAIGLALVILNGVGVAIATKLTSRALGDTTGLRLVPTFLLVGAASALISRMAGIQPPVIVGVILAATFAARMATKARGIVALTQLAAITVLSTLAWFLHGWLGPVEGFWDSFASETLAALCLAGLGSLVLLLLPVSGLPGRHLFEWSPGAWVVTALVGATIAATVVATGPAFPTGWVVAGAVVFAALSLSVWGWVRFVEPAQAETSH